MNCNAKLEQNVGYYQLLFKWLCVASQICTFCQ